MNYTLKVEYNQHTDEYYIILPKQLLDQAGWVEGDKLTWKRQKDGSFIVSKEKTK